MVQQGSSRKKGASVGQGDVYFYSPKGQLLRSKFELSRYIKKQPLTRIEDLSLSTFSKTIETSESESQFQLI